MHRCALRNWSEKSLKNVSSVSHSGYTALQIHMIQIKADEAFIGAQSTIAEFILVRQIFAELC
jgi:hypothetical protein